MKGLCDSSSTDRISNLPAVLADHIVTFLPLKEAARAATLSAQWRYCWRNVPRLVFDASFARTRWSESESNVHNLMNNIYEAVLLHDSYPTTKFVLAIPGLRPCDEIDSLILHLANNKVLRDFTLRILDESGWYVYDLWNFPSLFAALELNALKLQSCGFKPPPGFVGFNKLAHLELKNVMLDEDFFVDFGTKCPLLEDLRILDCCGLGSPLGIDAPRLKVLCLRVILRSIWFKYTPLLSLVSIIDERDYLSNKLYNDQQGSVNIVDVFASLPALQELKLGIEFLQLLAAGDHVPRRLPTPLQHLKVLEMDNIVLHSLSEARVLLCLIMSSPNLKTLTIQIDGRQRAPPLENVIDSLGSLLQAGDLTGLTGCCFQHLEDLTIDGTHGSQVELDLVSLVRANAQLLRRIVINGYTLFESREFSKVLERGDPI